MWQHFGETPFKFGVISSFSWKWPFFDKRHHTIEKDSTTQPRQMIFWLNKKFLKADFWAKLGPMLWKNKEIGIINGLFPNFALGIHLKERISDHRNTWVEIKNQNSKKYHILRKLGLNFCPLFWVKNSKKQSFSGFLL